MTKINLDFVENLTLQEKADLVSGKDFWFTAKVPGVDAMMMTDGPSGLRKQENTGDALGINDAVDAVCFPSSALTACSFDDQMLYKLGEHLGIAANAEHIGVLLGPGVNIKRSPLAGRNFEYFSEEPLLAGRMGTAYVKGVQSKGVGVSVKHFAANNRENQRFTSSSNIDERTLREVYLAQFEQIVKEAHPATIMCSYNRLNGTLNSQNQRLLTDILRNEWGFEGLVMSDWGAVADHIAAIKAGLDLEMPGKGDVSTKEIINAVHSGMLEESTLNRSVLRVLKMAEKYGRQNQPRVKYDKAEQHAFARQMADDGIVLLKNAENLLPLNGTQSIAVIGELAKKPRYEGGGSSHVNAHKVVTPLEASPTGSDYAAGYSLAGKEEDYEQAITLAKNKDVVVFFAGFPAEMETEGFDKQTINLPANQTALLSEILKVNPNVIVVLENGSAVAMPWADQVPAIVETYLAGEAVGEATWDILMGKVNPSGKLAESFPLRLEDNPTYGTFDANHDNENYYEGIFVGYRYYDLHNIPVRFPFGHGLSYTDFEYHNLKLKEDSNSVHVTFEIQNTGDRTGKDVPQLYLGNRASRVEVPVWTLVDFIKVELQPGEEKAVTFELPRRAFSWYNATEKRWEADNGKYQIAVGHSSRELSLIADFELTIGIDPVGHITGDTYVGELMAMKSAKVMDALKNAKMLDTIKQSLATPDGAAIFNNIPIRSLTMTGIKHEQIIRFLRDVNY
ncbi:glycoside hydrolase family 3 C-terminal domain-containing protein [Limosilactobacillus sp. STM2_1]|uniref:Glycoside hydrolase family 3 C-terminal domain-containing protein n=1 Tax=Limosilactobacillus rudii TaxID=2759755 RepID=A0A7W3UMU9_9LACO|nr:glycoside hydrolase family 3 C-terminal domain-containing protein [Limosilactobacillus rudii]MBB1080423.1 glycoside hydrolase family 3 C-terminal domain-containing protein [Limosilactobacillus rudii]MBB1098449.1 glycoside hydrolase family 3 C-terminal domain-containing protein [Limosilactobacillus rudii]MCD7135457.1 glycoside hydrolase family 3 C-terminal domain-containing protein [Limosilactobacillus rudii]